MFIICARVFLQTLLKKFPQRLCTFTHLVSLSVLFHWLATKTIDTHHEIYNSEFVEHAILALAPNQCLIFGTEDILFVTG